jgi:alkanesulfonate monooxygenase SsuD/methylene tetrahydromethanopterin reductase-like flavin-dependent oxidoreductase (luciferase family)
MVRVGLTLPSFRDRAEPALAVARAADAAGVDAVFAYDHLFRRTASGERRPAIEMLSLMGAVAAATRRVAVGSLVARASLRPPAVLTNAIDTVARIAGVERTLLAVGAGDEESREENESFGLGFGTVEDRITALRETVVASRDRGYPVWIGGRDPAVRALAAAQADGWNLWGGRNPERFAAQATDLRTAAARSPFTVSWGGLFVLGADERAARAKADRLGAGPQVHVGGPARVAEVLRAYAEAGAGWVIVGPVDSSDPENANLLGEVVSPLLS